MYIYGKYTYCEECQYICSNERASGQSDLPAQADMGVTPMAVAAPGAAAPTQGAQPGASGGQPMATDDPAAAAGAVDAAFDACCAPAGGDDRAAGVA